MTKTETPNTDFTDTVALSPFEEILAERFGERFRVYRKNYQDSLVYFERDDLPEFPLTVTLELVNRCNLNCVMCYTINHHDKKSVLDVGEIGALLEECSRHDLPAVVVGLGSEPLLHKGVRDVLGASAKAGVMDIFLGTNGVLLTEEMSRFLISTGVSRLEVSLDAAEPETYRKIRGKDELARIEENLLTFRRLRDEAGASLPVLRLCFCVQELNVDEQDAFLDKWKDVADYIDFQRMRDFSVMRDPGLHAPGQPLQEVEDPVCAYPFNSLHVWSNGDVTPCCTFFAKSELLNLGNIKDQSLKQIWDGEKINAIRHQLRTGMVNPICAACLKQKDSPEFETAKARNKARAQVKNG